MTHHALTPSSPATTRSPNFLLRAVGGTLAAVSMVIVNLGCGCSGPLDDLDLSWGCLVEGDVDGAPAQAQAETTARGTTVWLSPSSPGAHGAVITLPEAALATLPVGELPADARIEIAVCQGDTVTACVPVRDAVVEVLDLGDGTARASYSGTTLDARGRTLPAEGSFVFVRGAASDGV